MPRPATRKPLPALFLFLISWLAIPCARSDEVIQLPTGVQTRLIAVSGRTLLVTVKTSRRIASGFMSARSAAGRGSKSPTYPMKLPTVASDARFSCSKTRR